MPFTKKTWEDRLVEFAGRRKLTNVTTQAVQTVDVTRDEGNVSREGTTFSATNMNDLEQRIADCISSMETTFQGGVNTLYNQCVSCGVTPTSKSPAAIASAIVTIYNNRYNAGISDTKKGDAAAGNVLSGKTFTSASAGVNVSGTMPNRGALNWTPNGSESKSVSAGYYSGGTLNSANAYNAGHSAGYNSGYNDGQAAAIPGYQKVGSKIADGTPTNFTYTFSGNKTIYVVAVGLYDQTPFSLNLYLNGNAEITQKEYAKHDPVLYAIWEVQGTTGQSISLTSQAYIGNTHMVESYIIG